MKKLSLLLVLSLSVTGCEQYVEVETSPIGVVEREYVLAFVLDTSGSFYPRMFGGNEVAYKFFLRASDQFFMNRIGEGKLDRILISQLSADNRTLLWEGPPLSLRRKFGSSATLQRFIEEKSNPGGSRAYAALADTLDYLYELPGVKEGKTQVCVLVLSDFLDNSPTQQEDQQRMTESLERFAKTKNCIGMYWVDQLCVNDCRRWLAEAGIKDSVVEGDIVDDPTLPFSQP
jgi:hypothetical protein